MNRYPLGSARESVIAPVLPSTALFVNEQVINLAGTEGKADSRKKRQREKLRHFIYFLTGTIAMTFLNADQVKIFSHGFLIRTNDVRRLRTVLSACVFHTYCRDISNRHFSFRRTGFCVMKAGQVVLQSSTHLSAQGAILTQRIYFNEYKIAHLIEVF